ncbi:MAG: hypothetical protein WA981_12730 [Glaciecola sp.]
MASTYKFIAPFIAVSALTLLHTNASANNGGVHGPNIKANTQSAEIRMNTSHSDNASDGRKQYRTHYQRAFSDSFQVRVVAQFRDFGDFEYDNAKVEMLYQYQEFENANYAAAVRFDVRTRRGNRPEDIAIHWTHQYNLSSKVFARGIAIFGKNVTDNNAGNKPSTFGTRFSINYKQSSNVVVGAELYSNYGEIDNFNSSNSQVHQIGPAVMYKHEGWYAYARYLTGLTSASPDNNFQFRMGKRF